MFTSVNAQWLTTGNNKILKDGNPITLRGINFGNWLVWEGYMMNLKENGHASPSAIRSSIKSLLGNDESKTLTFETNWRNSYITEADFQKAKALGYNVIRIPFHYNMFWNGWSTKNDGFTWLDKAATWAQNNGIHVIFCMHCAPGCQNPGYHSDNYSSDDRSGIVNFWNDWNNVTIAGKVWRLIAAKYTNNPWIAGYDLLNEPVLNDNAKKYLLKQSYIAMTEQIRAVDGNHLIFAEGNYSGADFWDMRGQKWDKNLVFESHYYGDQNESDPNPDLSTRISLANEVGVPLFTGEFGENNASWVKNARVKYETQNVGWAFWAWKRQATDRSIYSFNSPAGWDQITNYINDGVVARPSVANVESCLRDLCNNVRIQSCTFVSSLQNTLRPGWPTGSVIWLQNSGKYVNSQDGGPAMTCTSGAASTWEKFTIVDAGDWKIALLGNNGKYVNSWNGNKAISCTSGAIGGWEAFEWVDVYGNVALKGFNGKFISSEGGSYSGMNCNRETVSGWESFAYAPSTKSLLIAPEVKIETDKSVFTIYPNPVTDGIVNLLGIQNNSILQIFNISGQQVMCETVNSETKNVNVSSLASGVYTVVIKGDGLSRTTKLVIGN